MQLSVPTKDLSLAPLSVIKKNLDRIFGQSIWANYELETISLELNLILDDLTRDKISVLQLMERNKSLFAHDILFFLHAVDVINNSIAEFDNFPLPSSLELAYAYYEYKKLYPEEKIEFSSTIKKTIVYILTLEGYSEPVWPFNEIGISTENLSKGQTAEDTDNKRKAIQQYIQGMNSVAI